MAAWQRALHDGALPDAADDWQRIHLRSPRDVVPESVMPPYAFLAKKHLDYRDIADKLRAQRTVGVPYSDAMIANAVTDLETQADPFASGGTALKTRYGAKINQRDFDGQPDKISDMDALIAYLQVLGTMVDFSTFQPDPTR